MALGIGIFDNVTLTTKEINEYGGLNLTFAVKANKPEAATGGSVLDFLSAEAPEGPGFDQENKVSIYALKGTNSKGETLEPALFQKDNGNLKAQLEEIAKNYGVPLTFSFAGITLPKTVEEIIASEETLAAISTNYFTQFLTAMEKADLTTEFRMVFPRKSKGSKYPGLRNKMLKDFPFMEPMSVEKEKSKLRFTKYEMEQGLDKPLEVSADPNNGGDVASLFGETSAPVVDELALPFAQ